MEMGKKQAITVNMRELCGDTLADLLEKRLYILLAFLVFCIGASTSLFVKDLASALIRLFVESLRPHIIDKTYIPLFLFILSRNAVALFLMVFLGMVFSIFPLLALFANGFIVGAALLYAPLSWWQLLPHGIFEIPAIFIAAAYGIWLGFWPFASARDDGLRRRLKTCSFAYIRVILPLLVFAALIESLLITHMR